MRFRSKIALGISCIVVAMAVVFFLTLADMATNAVLIEGRKRGRTMAENLAVRSAEPLLAQDLLRLKNLVTELKTVSPDIEYAFLLDVRGRVLAHTFQGGFPVALLEVTPPTPTQKYVVLETQRGFIYDFASPVILAGAELGEVRLGLSRAQVLEPVSQLSFAVFAITVGALLAALTAGLAFAHRVTRRINLLKNHAVEVVKGNLDLQTAPGRRPHCWETMQCGLENCPAYGDERRRCWHMAGVFHPTEEFEDDPLHMRAGLPCPVLHGGADDAPETASVCSPVCTEDSCDSCPVYQSMAGDEIQDLAEAFDVMALTLKTHIMELQEAERSLVRQQRLMRTIMDVTPDFVGLMDENLVYLAVNKAFAEHLGRRVEDVIGKRDADLFPPKEAAAREQANRAALEAGVVRTAEVAAPHTPPGEAWGDGLEVDEAEGASDRARPEDAAVRWLHVVWTPVRDAEGRCSGLLRTDRDVTELRKYQEQLLHSQKMESVGKLAGGVAHEINTPLGVILGYAQLLQDDVEQDSQILKDLKTIEKQAKVCRKIVADLLGFSRRGESAKREMCFNNSVMEVVTLVNHTFNMDHVRIITEMDDRMPIIFGDPEKLKQVWINLLNNARDAIRDAIKDGERTAGAVVVKTRLSTPESKVSVFVADTGPGVPPETLPKLFDPFFSTKPVGKGTGLGLSVSFGIIEDHDGDIQAESPPPPAFYRSLSPQTRAALHEAMGAEGPEALHGALFTVDLPLDHEGDLDSAHDKDLCSNDDLPATEAAIPARLAGGA